MGSMFGRPKQKNALEPPPIAGTHPDAVEVLRVWAAPGMAQQVALQTVWKEPGAWGLMLVDVARHAAKAYARDGHDEKAVLERIRTFLDAEWSIPTDTPEDLTQEP